MTTTKNESSVRGKRAAATADAGAKKTTKPSLEWVRTRRVAAFIFDYALFAIVGLTLVVLMTILFEDLTAVRIPAASMRSGSAADPMRAIHENTPYGLARYIALLLTLAATLAYVVRTLGGKMQATLGMRIMSLRLRRLDGKPIAPTYAAAHWLLFFALNALFTPLTLLAPLFLARKQTVHDRLLDTVMTRQD
ncbi:RDD family protein [Nitratireductor pacificus]|uniref:RDD domain-containing protein n=1 Tax=Nitratireductor pacificus pht-3B TaxID=391937 RepID=K2LRA5_9HYPH|nr:RDD family protein [Nitratireductor pacificus]EKF20269.1 RDD domain-containing protein [Nitratireductor pacificus pht-3B]